MGESAMDTDEMKPGFVDFFAGSGLVTEALSPYFTPLWANDICPKKAAVYQANHGGGHFHLGSIAGAREADGGSEVFGEGFP